MNWLLIIEIVFSIMLLCISINAFDKKKYMLFLFSIFTVFYVLTRQVLLLSDNYLSFAILNPAITSFNKEAILILFIYIVISYFIFYISYTYFYKKNIVQMTKYNTKRDYGKIIILVSLLTIFLIDSFVGMVYLVYLFVYNYYKNNRHKLLIIVSLIVLMYLFTFTDDRRNWLFLILSILFMLFAKSKKQNIIKILLYGFISFVLLFYILIAYRTNGLLDYSAVYDRLNTNSSALMGIFEIESDFPIVSDDLILLFDNVVIKKKIDYTYGVNFFKPLYSFIPREIWENKPVSISRVFAKKFNYNFYAQGGSEPITIYGELFWNFGILSFLFYILIGYISAYFDKKIKLSILCKNDSELSLYIVYISLSFIILRGPLDTFWLMYLSTILLIIVEKTIPNFLYRKKK